MDSQNAGGPDRDSVTDCGYPALNHVEIITDEGRAAGRGRRSACRRTSARLSLHPQALHPPGLAPTAGSGCRDHLSVDGEAFGAGGDAHRVAVADLALQRSEEHTAELQSLMRSSYAVFCLNKKKKKQ